jgi:hypothetical protein
MGNLMTSSRQRFRPVALASAGPAGSAFSFQNRTIARVDERGTQMAFADYYQCDVCGAKCFYEAGMNWEQKTRRNPIPDEHLVRGLSAKLDFCGDMKAICRDCAKTHVCQVVEK